MFGIWMNLIANCNNKNRNIDRKRKNKNAYIVRSQNHIPIIIV